MCFDGVWVTSGGHCVSVHWLFVGTPSPPSSSPFPPWLCFTANCSPFYWYQILNLRTHNSDDDDNDDDEGTVVKVDHLLPERKELFRCNTSMLCCVIPPSRLFQRRRNSEYPPCTLLLHLMNLLSWKSIIFSYSSNCSFYVDNLLPSCTVTNTTMLLLSWRFSVVTFGRWIAETLATKSVLGVLMSVCTTIRSVADPAGLPLKAN